MTPMSSIFRRSSRPGPVDGRSNLRPTYRRSWPLSPATMCTSPIRPLIRVNCPFGIGLAILSRTPLRDVFAETIPSPAIEFDFFGEKKTPTDRLLIGATAELGGRPVRLLNTHLLALFMLNSDSRRHPEQRRRVAGHLRAAQTAGSAAILSGDFNVRDHVGLTAEYAAEGFTTVQTSRVTWRRQPYVLDHIFHNSPLRCVAHEVTPTMASDHHALTADFVWSG